MTKLNILLDTNVNLKNKERVHQVFMAMYSLMSRYPILSQMASSTEELIFHKVRTERLVMFSNQNLDDVFVLSRHGIRFKSLYCVLEN